MIYKTPYNNIISATIVYGSGASTLIFHFNKEWTMISKNSL